MRRKPMRLAVTGLAVALFSFTAMGFAQDQPVNIPHTPDLLGIYIGMPMQKAEDQLQKHSNDVYVETAALPLDFSLTTSDPANADITTVYLTQPPNNPPTVWMVTRAWTYMPSGKGPGMTMSALLSALHEKYGQETMRRDQAGIWLYWIFDQNGRLLSHADPALANCRGSDFVEIMHGGVAPNVSTLMETCFKNFFALTVSLNASPRDTLIGGYHVELVNLPYAARAATVTSNAKNAAANRARQEQIKRANQNKPTF
jgi:hypothetical protein